MRRAPGTLQASVVIADRSYMVRGIRAIQRCRPVRTGIRALLGAAGLALCVMPVAAYAATEYRVTGRGFGHGIGLSQYGAKGFAERGYTAGQIIRYYYQGTTIGAVPADARAVSVKLVSDRTTVAFQVDGASARLANGTRVFNFVRNDRIELRVEGSGMDLYRRRNGTTARLANGLTGISAMGNASTIKTLFTADSGSWGHHYRGSLRIHRVGSALTVINRVAIEQYLRGVVPGEMPASWHMEALKAQTIAARSYAIATRKPSGLFDLFADTRSQVYRGIEHEQVRSDAAITATSGDVAKHAGAVIPAFFYSSSGGRTAAIEDVWNSAPRPYLKSVRDPYEQAPYTPWPEVRAYSPGQLARHLRGYVAGSFRSARVAVNPSRRADTVIVTGSGGRRTMPASTFQIRLGLRSTWFRIEKLMITVGSPTGNRVRIRGVIPSTGRTYLMRRTASGWATARRLTPGTGGAFNVTVDVAGATHFGLRRHGATGAVERL